jgi:hypothetical protein
MPSAAKQKQGLRLQPPAIEACSSAKCSQMRRRLYHRRWLATKATQGNPKEDIKQKA